MQNRGEISNWLELAISLHQAGQFSEAETLYRQVLRADPLNPDANHNLALLLMNSDLENAMLLFLKALEAEPQKAQFWLSYIESLVVAGKLVEAKNTLDIAESYGLDRRKTAYLHSSLNGGQASPSNYEINQLITLFSSGLTAEAESESRIFTVKYPKHGIGWKVLGAALAQQSIWGEALVALTKATELMPSDAESHFNLGLAYQLQSDWANAESCYVRALALIPNYPEALNNIGLLQQAKDAHNDAIHFFQKAISANPDFAQAYNNLALSLHRVQRYNEAIDQFTIAVRMHPKYAEAYNNLGVSLQAIGNHKEAEKMLRCSIQMDSQYASAYNNLGNLLQEIGRIEDAENMLQTALKINPLMPDAYNNLGNVYQAKRKFHDALVCYEKSLGLNPNDAQTLNNLGTVLQSLGNFSQAISYYQKAISVNPNFLNAHSNLLFIFNYLIDSSPEENHRLAIEYGKLVSSQASKILNWKCQLNPKRLRVGMVSGDLINHPVGYFLENVLKELHQGVIELFAYSTHHQEDSLTTRIRPFFSQWKSIVGIQDSAAASIVQQDQIHVLLDLSGHTAYNRLSMFAYKPAPVQATWLGYFATTGVMEIDYLIADPWTLPQEQECFFTERIWRLPETRFCFSPPEERPKSATLPALKNGFITFGCFNSLNKLNDEVISTWAEILLATPSSKLILKAPQLLEFPMQEFTKKRFEKYGIEPDRLLLEEPSSRQEYLLKYQQIDIALDPFPFTGGTTSAECLWMGVPIITLAGKQFVSRQGVGLLENLGLPELIAEDRLSYVNLAVKLASNLSELKKVKRKLNRQISNSPIFDSKRFAKHLEDALWEMWRAFLTKQHG